MHISCWSEEPELQKILDRLHSVHPQQSIQTHILHLASEGEIFVSGKSLKNTRVMVLTPQFMQPHVDNVDASGSWILGVSLGNTRILRLECATDPSDKFEILLPSGSIYIQRHVGAHLLRVLAEEF